MIDHIDQKRKDLGLGPTMYPVPYEGKQDVSARHGVPSGSRELLLAGGGGPPQVCPGGPGSVLAIQD
jgi:hypothetical protein